MHWQGHPLGLVFGVSSEGDGIGSASAVVNNDSFRERAPDHGTSRSTRLLTGTASSAVSAGVGATRPFIRHIVRKLTRGVILSGARLSGSDPPSQRAEWRRVTSAADEPSAALL